MRKILLFLTAFFITKYVLAQEELNAIVTVNSDKVQSTNKQVFKTLESSITEFINQTKWTSKKFLTHERINCAFTIIINEQSNNNFKASLQVQATRPIYNSTYESPILNINDDDLSFRYLEFQPFNYNPNSFDNNLVSTLVFYVYTVLGVDADTYELNGGGKYFRRAENVMRQAQQSGDNAWQNRIGEQNKYALIDGFLSPKFSKLRQTYYNYHRLGLDVFSSDQLKAKNYIAESIISLKSLMNIDVGNYMLRVFMDSKTNEIVNIFSKGIRTNTESKLQDALVKFAPAQSSKFKKIK